MLCLPGIVGSCQWWRWNFHPNFQSVAFPKIKPPEVHCLLAQMKKRKRSKKKKKHYHTTTPFPSISHSSSFSFLHKKISSKKRCHPSDWLDSFAFHLTPSPAPSSASLTTKVPPSRRTPCWGFHRIFWGGNLVTGSCKNAEKNSLPGDSIRDLFIPDRWRSLNHLEGSLNHPKKVTSRIARWWLGRSYLKKNRPQDLEFRHKVQLFLNGLSMV